MATTYFFITPPIKNTVWEFWCLLTSQADTDVFQTSVTLAAGDVTVILDGVSQGNIDTLPTEIGTSGWLYVQLSADEMNGDKFTGIKFHDAAGAEWQDKAFLIPIMQAVTVSDFDESTDTVTPADGSITAAKIADGAIDNATFAADVGSTAYASNRIALAADKALGQQDLDHLIQVTAGSEKPTDGSYLDQIMNKDGSQTFSSSTDSLEAIRDRLSTATVNVVTFVEGDTLNFVVSATFDETLPDSETYTISSDWSKMYFTLKRDTDEDIDIQAVIMIQETNGGASSDGLIVLNGSSSGLTAADASLTVDQSAGTIRLTITDDAMAELSELDGLTWDFKEITDAGESNVITQGNATISYTPTRAIT